MAENDINNEKLAALDISAPIIKIIDDTADKGPKTFIIGDYLGTLRSEPALSIVMDWHGPDWAIWAKSFVEDQNALGRGQKREISIRCSESEKAQVPNVFASAVKWINSDELQQGK